MPSLNHMYFIKLTDNLFILTDDYLILLISSNRIVMNEQQK